MGGNASSLMSLCNVCGSGTPGAGQFAFESFNKVPVIGGGIGAFLQIVNGGLNMNTISNLIGGGGQQGQSGAGGMFGNIIGALNPSQGPAGGTSNFPSIGQVPGGLDLSKFLNLLPVSSVKAGDGNLADVFDSGKDIVVKKILKSNYKQLIEKYKGTEEYFTDPEFPPNQSSIGNLEDEDITQIRWKRIREVIKDPQFVTGTISPGDILQGSLGDCYFLSALAALAEQDYRIKNLFPDLQIQPNGVYMCRILFNGVYQEVVVDDYIPVDKKGNVMFAQPAGGKEVWVMIAEKCWAKLYGSYAATVGGLPNEVLHAFSSAPVFYKSVPTDKGKQDSLWSSMYSADQKGAILCCGTKGDDPNIQSLGFVKGHAYTLVYIGLFETPYRLMKIRNPWGKKEWKGRGSESDEQFWSKMSPADKQRVGFDQKNSNDGTFFILYEDFVQYFDMVDVCKINDNAHYNFSMVDFDIKNGQMFDLEVKGSEAGLVTLGLTQQNTRGKGQAAEDRGYARSTIVVAEHNQTGSPSEFRFIKSSSQRNFADHYVQLADLKPGKYVVFAKFNWNNGKGTNPATVFTSAAIPAVITQTKQSAYPQFLHKTFLDHATNNPKKQVLSSSPSQWICSDFLLGSGGYGYLAIHLDASSKKRMQLEIDQSEYTKRKLTLKRPQKGKGAIREIVEPGKDFIMMFRMKENNFPKSMTLPTPKITNAP